MKKYFCSKKIPYILVFMTAALLCLQFMSGFVPYNAAAGARNSLTVWYGNEKFRYYDELIMPTDHLVAEELHDNYVNASPQKKAAYVKQLVKKGISRKKALTAAYPELQRFFEGFIKIKRTAQSLFIRTQKISLQSEGKKPGAEPMKKIFTPVFMKRGSWLRMPILYWLRKKYLRLSQRRITAVLHLCAAVFPPIIRAAAPREKTILRLQ